MKRGTGSTISTDASSTPSYECRNCGTTLEENRDTCPACGADGIARYEID